MTLFTTHFIMGGFFYFKIILFYYYFFECLFLESPNLTKTKKYWYTYKNKQVVACLIRFVKNTNQEECYGF